MTKKTESQVERKMNVNSYLALVQIGNRVYEERERDERIFNLARFTRLLPTTRDIRMLYEQGDNRKDAGANYLGSLLAICNFLTANMPKQLENLEQMMKKPEMEFKQNKATIILVDKKTVQRILEKLDVQYSSKEDFTGYQFITEVKDGQIPNLAYALELPYSERPELKEVNFSVKKKIRK